MFQVVFTLALDENLDLIEKGIRDLEAARQSALYDRRSAIVLGGLHRRLGRLADAVTKMTEAIKANLALNRPALERADMLYNRACYRALLGDKEAAFEDLIRSLRILPGNADDTRTDDDFQSLRDDPRFAALLANPHPHRILVVGSCVNRDRTEFERNCRDLGWSLAGAGFGFVVGSFSENTADRYVLEGLNESQPPIHIAFICPAYRWNAQEAERMLGRHLVERQRPLGN